MIGESSLKRFFTAINNKNNKGRLPINKDLLFFMFNKK